MIREGQAVLQLDPDQLARVLDAHDAGKLKSFGVKTERELAEGRGCILQVAWGVLKPMAEATPRGLNPGTVENTLAKFDFIYDADHGTPKLSRHAFRQVLERTGFAKVTS